MFNTSDVLMRNVHTQIAERIGTSIVRGEIAPGDALPSEMQICEMLGVSRTVVREAIRMLTGKGLIETRAKSGNRVRQPENWNYFDQDVLRWRLAVDDVDHYLSKLFVLRKAMEPAAAALAATAATAEDKQRIRTAVEAMAAARTNEQFVEADIDFHKSIYIATRNEFFWPIAQMFDLTLRQSIVIAATGDHRARAIAEHRAVMEAIVTGDADTAREATVELLEQAANDLVRIRSRNPFK